MRIVTETNRVLPETAAVPTGTAGSAAEKITGRKGMTLKVDGVVIAPSAQVPSGDVYEVVEWAAVTPELPRAVAASAEVESPAA